MSLTRRTISLPFFRSTGNPKEHIKRFNEHPGSHCKNKKLRLRDLSKSLTDKSYTWYVHLAPKSVSTWEEMPILFVQKFFLEEDEFTLTQLRREKQRSREKWWPMFEGSEKGISM